MTEVKVHKGRFVKGDPRTLAAAKKGGEIGGKLSPSNFKNNSELAAKAGRKGGQISRRKKAIKKEEITSNANR